MNILYICDEYPPSIHGGIGSATAVLAEQMAADGHTVCVAGIYPPYRKGKEYEEVNGVHIFRFKYGKRRILPWALRRLIPLKFRYSSIKKEFDEYTAGIQDIICRYKIDVIEMPDYQEIFFNGGGKHLQYPHFGIPVVIKTHGSYSFLHHQKKRAVPTYLRDMEQQLYNTARGVVAVSKFSGDQIRNLFNITPQTSIRTIYNGIRITTPIASHSKINRVIFAGSLVPTKGIYQLIKAWNLVVSEFPGASLIVCGKGKAQTIQELQALLESNFRNTVTFMNHINRNQLLELFEASTIAVFPSYFENFSMAPLEAMSRGCATIYTSRASGPEIINNGEDGLLIEPDNIQELANALLWLLKNDHERTVIAEKGRYKIQDNFSLDHIAAQHLKYYTEIINQ